MFSVFNPRGEKIADCGTEKDAVNLMKGRNRRWNGHYFTYVPPLGDIVDITNNQLSGWQEVSEKQFDEMFIEVTGKQQLQLQQSELPEANYDS